MAVDPLTAKILAKVAMQAATDSESRKRILFMILAPVLGLLLLIAFILYLITSPFSVLSQWLIGDEVNVVEDFQKQYGYNQQLGIYEKDYIDGSGQSYEGVIFTDGATEVVYYNQLDERWADLPYGTDNREITPDTYPLDFSDTHPILEQTFVDSTSGNIHFSKHQIESSKNAKETIIQYTDWTKAHDILFPRWN